jgi:hypothetical protein
MAFSWGPSCRQLGRVDGQSGHGRVLCERPRGRRRVRQPEFALGTGLIDPETLRQQATWGNEPASINLLGSIAADALACAIVRAMLSAQTAGTVPSYKDRFPGRLCALSLDART